MDAVSEFNHSLAKAKIKALEVLLQRAASPDERISRLAAAQILRTPPLKLNSPQPEVPANHPRPDPHLRAEAHPPSPRSTPTLTPAPISGTTAYYAAPSSPFESFEVDPLSPPNLEINLELKRNTPLALLAAAGRAIPRSIPHAPPPA